MSELIIHLEDISVISLTSRDNQGKERTVKRYKVLEKYRFIRILAKKYIDSFDRSLEYLIPKISDDIRKRSTGGKLVITSVLNGRSGENRFLSYLEKLSINKSKVLPLLEENIVVIPNLFVKKKKQSDIADKYEKTIENIEVNSKYKSFMNPNNRFFILDDVTTVRKNTRWLLRNNF